MKKVYLLLILILLFVTGCNSKDEDCVINLITQDKVAVKSDKYKIKAISNDVNEESNEEKYFNGHVVFEENGEKVLDLEFTEDYYNLELKIETEKISENIENYNNESQKSKYKIAEENINDNVKLLYPTKNDEITIENDKIDCIYLDFEGTSTCYAKILNDFDNLDDLKNILNNIEFTLE